MEFTLSTAGEWFGSAIISKLLDTASSYLGERMLPADTKSELRRVKAALPKIAAVMGVGEALKLKRPNSGVNAWLEQFKEAFLAAEDVLDELKYWELEDMVKNRDQVSGSSSSIIGSLKRKFTGSNISEDTLERLREAVEMLDLAAADVGHIFQIAIALDVHGHAKPNNQPVYTSSQETTSFLTESKVFGRENETAIINEWLKKSASHGNISALCIVGAGGLGKTTLAQFIFEEISRENHFDETIWVCISTSFGVQDITRKILEDLGEKTHNGESLNGLLKSLKERILSKKVFLILDDAWNDYNMGDWEKLVAPLKFLPQESKILITTRMKSVGDMFAHVLNGEQENLVLKGLEQQDLLELLNKYAFYGYNPDYHKDLQKIGNDIVKKLRGSPLAAKVIGSLLNSNVNFHYWKRILNHDSLINLEQAKDMANVLKLSYYHLPAHLQECFRFCCIFPQDYKFDKDELIKMWMASGFIRQELHGGARPEDIGEEYFNYLFRKCFFEKQFGYERFYVMHDLMHDLAQNVSKGECCRVEPNGESDNIPLTAQHVAVPESKIERIFNLRNLRTLVITLIGDQFVPPNGSLKKTLRLLVIQGEGRCELPEEIGSLLHLRFLKVNLYSRRYQQSYRYLLHNSLYKLYHLQVLEMTKWNGLFPDYEGIETTGITNLVSLRHMNLPNEVMQKIHGVHKLTSLQELHFCVGQESGQHIDELEMLNNLRYLSIDKIENVGDPLEATNANLSKKESLISLSLEWTKGSNYHDPEQVIDNLRPNPNLKQLTIWDYTGHRSPIWTSDCALERLYCFDMPNWESWAGPHICYGFPNLKELVIKDCPNLANIPTIPFSLFKFEVRGVGLNSLPDMHHSSSITDEAPSCMKSSLRIVQITECPKLISLNGFLQQKNLDLQSVWKLIIGDCENLVQLPTGAFGNFVSLKHLLIYGSPKLVTVDNQSILLPAKLEYLEMGNCGELDVPLIESASHLSTLATLSIINSANIFCIPSSEKAFTSLRHLCIGGCDKLIEISSMPQAHTVNQGNNLVSLKINTLAIDHLCLLRIEPLRCLRFVSSLIVGECSGMEALPEQWLLQNSSTLKRLSINDASSLRSLPGTMVMLTTLEWLEILKADLLEELPELPASLKEKYIEGRGVTCSSENALRSLNSMNIDGSNKLVKHSFSKQEHGALTNADCAMSYVVENLVSTAYSYLHDHVLLAEYEVKLKRLQKFLPRITTVMGIVEALKIKIPSANLWVHQFRQDVEASEDILDELEYKKLEDMIENQDEADRSASTSKKRKACNVNDDTLEMLKEAITMLDRAAAETEHLLQVSTRLGINGLSVSPQEASNEVLRHETNSILAKMEVFGRVVEKENIIGWLKRPTLACLSSLSIVGVGGVGKTTLVQFAYQEMCRSNHFDKIIWVCVSINFSIEDLTRKMLGELGESSCSGKSLKTLLETLKEKIHLKKILFILDDVWDDEKRSDWEQLVAPLRFAQEGSKILFTTRMQSVADLLASVINTEHESLALGCLGDQELRELFYSYAFHGFNPDNHKDLQTVGDQILKMLRGSTLAAKVIGSLLNSYMDHNYWRRALNYSSIFKLQQAKDVVEVLKLSYYHLPADLQACFKFCSIFPQGHKFDKDGLIKMWMAVGIIRQELCQGNQLEDIGEQYFNLLLKNSFFEYSKSWEGERYVMNELMHELAQKVSHGECCRIEANDKAITIPSTVRHVYVHQSEIQKISHLANLRSLIIATSVETTGTDPNIFVLPKNLIKKSLRLLKVCGCKYCELPEEISCLVHLRYLAIKVDYETQSFKYLFPASIYNLYHLQVLEFSNDGDYSGSETTRMTNLVSLRYMRLPKEIIQTIHGIHRLTSLQELTFFVGQESGHRINELGTLNNLRHLSINRIENIGGPVEAKSANLLGKSNLMSLYLKWTSERNFDNHEQIIEYLQPHPNLMELTVENYKGHRSPSWMEQSHPLNLSSLKLFNCPLWNNQLFDWKMPYLKILHICDCLNLEKLPNMPLSLIEFRVHNVGLTSLPDLYQSAGNNTPQPFSLKSSLRVVEIENCPNLISLNGFLQQDNLDLPATENFIISGCEELVLVPIDTFGKLLSLKHLRIKDCQNLTRCPSLPLSLNEFCLRNVGVSALPEYYQSCDSGSGPSTTSLKSSLRVVEIESCPQLISLNGFLQQDNLDLQAIEKFIISGCEKLVSVAGGAFGKLLSLKHLSIKDCQNLTRCPGLPLSLTEFYLHNVGVIALPEYYQSSESRGGPSRSSLKSLLRIVGIRNCPKLTALNGLFSLEMPYLKILHIYHCVSLGKLPDMPLSLIEFRIRDVGLTSLPDLYQSSGNNTPAPLSLKSSLRVVKIERCPNLKTLDGFLQQGNRELQAIVELTIYACERLVHLPSHGFEKLTSLIYLTIYGCPNMVAVDNQSNLLPPKLKKLSIENCGKLDVPLLESASRLATLTDLSINSCANISHIPSEFAFGSVNELCIYGCKKLIEHSSREESHGADQGSGLASLKLSRLEIDHLSLLLIEPLRRLRYVNYLRVWYCSGMEALPEQWFLQNSGTLRCLSIRNASTLKSLPATMAKLTALEWLEIWKADLLQELPELPTTLRSLVVRDASSLKSLPARMARLTALEWLEIWKADLLEELPELPASLKEKYIEGRGITSQFGMFSRRYLSFDRV